MSALDTDFQLSLTAPQMPVAAFKRAVYNVAEAHQWHQQGVHILEPSHRGIDSAIQIALLQMGSTALGAILTGLFAIINARASSRIVIVGKNGTRMELPGRATQAEIERCVALLNQDPPKHIELLDD